MQKLYAIEDDLFEERESLTCAPLIAEAVKS
jgi:hypothetical protein